MPSPIPYISRNTGVNPSPDLGFWEDVGNNYRYQYSGLIRSVQGMFEPFAQEPAEEDFAWYDDIEGYEEEIEYLSQAKNQGHLDYLKQNLDIQRDIREKMTRGSFIPAIVAGLADPMNVAFALPIFNTGLRVAWQAKNAFGVGYESAKIALPFAVTREALRAPFDPYVTPEEIGTNISAEVLFSGLFGFAARGAANKIMQPKIQQNIRKYTDYVFDRDKVPTEVDGVKINPKPTTTASNEIIVYDVKGIPIKATIIGKSKVGTIKVRLENGKEEVLDQGTVFKDSIYDGINIDDVKLNTNELTLENAKKLLKEFEVKLQPFIKGKMLNQLRARDLIRYINAIKLRIKSLEGKSTTRPNDPVINKTSKKTRPDGSEVHAYYNRERNEIVWDKDALIKQFPLKPWLSPKVKGVLPLPDYLFQKPEDWARFVLHHEIAHSRNPFDMLKGKYEAMNPTQVYTKADYENEINNIAIEEFSKGFGLKQTAGTKSFLYKFITTPGKRILNNPEVLNETKKVYADLFFNASLSLEGNIAGVGTHGGSASARTIPYRATAIRSNKAIKKAYLMELKGSIRPTGLLGIDIDAIGVKLGNYGHQAQNYQDFYRNLVSFRIDMLTDPQFNMQLYNDLPDLHKEALTELDNLFKGFEKGLRDVGKLGDDTSLRRKKDEILKIIEFQESEIEKLNKNVVKGQTRQKYITGLQLDLAQTKKKLADAIKYKDKNIGKPVTREFFNKKIGRRDTGKFKYTLKMFNEDNAPLARRQRTLQLEIEKAKANPNYLGAEEFNAKVIPHQQYINKLKTELDFIEGVLDSPIRTYAFPHFFNKPLLLNDLDARERFTNYLTGKFQNEGGKKTWDEEKGAYIFEDASSATTARALAEKTVLHILEDPDVINLLPRSGKKKHLMQRVLNFPTHEMKEFLVLDERVVERYANQMGFHIEFGRKMGSMDIDDVLDRTEYIHRKAGMSEEKIASLRADLLGDYEREAGIHIRDPEARSQRYVRNFQSLAGMTYLHFAGVTSLIDAVASPIFRHGPRKVFQTGMDAINGDFPEMMKMGKMLREQGAEAIEMEVPIVQQRYLGDSVRDIQPRFTERFIQGAEKIFYRFNALSQVTSTAKQIDTNILIPSFYNRALAIKNKEAIIESGKDVTDSVIEDLARYGMTPDLVAKMVDQPWYVTDLGTPKVDVTKWADKTPADRDLKNSFLTYLGTHARNTIMNATAFDKPLVMDGFMYMRMNPVLKMMGYKPDKRASTANVKMVRLESAYFALPFKFYNFVFAATNRLTMNMFDPNVQHRLTGMLSFFAMSYLVLKLKKPDWWFENKNMADIIARTVDQSGIAGIYTDLAYHAIHSAIAQGYYNNNTAWIKGKFEPSVYDDLFDKLGATPSLIREWTLGAYELTQGQTDEGMKRLLRNTPVLGLFGLNRDLEYMFRTRY